MSRASSRLPVILLLLALLGAAGYVAWRMLEPPTTPEPVEPLTLQPDLPESDSLEMELRPVDADRPPPAPEAPRGATITGRIVTPALQPVTQGRVELERGTPLNLPGAAQLERLGLLAEIDELGFFAFTDVPPVDELAVRIEGETFAPTLHGPFATEPEALIDLGDLIVRPGLLIRGGVVDPRGQPVPGARVGLHETLLRNLGGFVSTPDPVRLQLTDEDGRFEFPHAVHAAFSLEVSAEGYARTVHEHNLYIDGDVPALDVTVTLLEVVPLEGLLLDRQTGEPLANEDVVAHPFLATHGRGLARTDRDGRFRFEDLSPGRYNIWADPVGHSRGGTVVDAEGWGSEVQLKLMRAGTLRGQVLDPDGFPVRSFDAQLVKHGTRQMPGSPVGRHQRVKGNADGDFRFEDLEPGLYSVEVWSKGYAYTQTKESMVKVRRGQDVSGFIVRMQRGAGLVGQVLNDLGQPVAGARVSLHANNMSEVDFIRSSDVQPRWMARTYTDREGWYQLDDITARAYQLQVDHSAYPVSRLNDVEAEAGVLLELSPIELPRPCTLQGVAVDGSGTPQIEATIWVSSADMATRQVRTDGKGRYVMRRLPPGSYQVVGAATHPELSDLKTIFQAELGRAFAHREGRQQLIDLSPGQTYEHTVVVDV